MADVPERNQVNLERIESGMDTRTTVMIKNIPNKMSDRDLERFIGEVVPGRMDFFYLRMDFGNGGFFWIWFRYFVFTVGVDGTHDVEGGVDASTFLRLGLRSALGLS